MTDYVIGDIVWAKLTGYPWWPAKIEDERNLSKKVLAAKPKGSSPVWPVKFFATFDYGWFGHDCLCHFEKGLAEHGSLNRRGNQFALAVTQAKDPHFLEDSDEAPVSKKPTKRSTRPGSQNVSKNSKRSASPLPKEKKAKIEKEPVEQVNSEFTNSSNTSPAHSTDVKRTRPVLSRNSKDVSSAKTRKIITEAEVEAGVETTAAELNPKSETNVEAIAKSSPPRTESPASPSSPKSRQTAKNKKIETLDDFLTMRALRGTVQKATVIEKYKCHETINSLLRTLEEGVFSPECIVATKMTKLMRHLYAHSIPKNDYRFKERFRLLAIRFKSLEAKVSTADNSSKESNGSQSKSHKKDNESEEKVKSYPSPNGAAQDKESSPTMEPEVKKSVISEADQKETLSSTEAEKKEVSSQNESDEKEGDVKPEEKDVDKEILSLVSDRKSDEETNLISGNDENKCDTPISNNGEIEANAAASTSEPVSPKTVTEPIDQTEKQNGAEDSNGVDDKHCDPSSNDHLEDKDHSQISPNEHSSASNESPRPESKDTTEDTSTTNTPSLNITKSPIKSTTEGVNDALVNP